MKKLPIGIQTFEKIIEDNFYYVDKTAFIQELAQTGSYYFLSRPRRFGKSLFLSTIKAAYQGKRQLFEGLHLERRWDWDATHHVVHASFGRIDMTVRLEHKVFIFEFKVLGPGVQAGTALEQIRRKRYADKYRAPGVEVHLVGVEFDHEERNIAGYAWERA